MTDVRYLGLIREKCDGKMKPHKSREMGGAGSRSASIALAVLCDSRL